MDLEASDFISFEESWHLVASRVEGVPVDSIRHRETRKDDEDDIEEITEVPPITANNGFSNQDANARLDVTQLSSRDATMTTLIHALNKSYAHCAKEAMKDDIQATRVVRDGQAIAYYMSVVAVDILMSTPSPVVRAILTGNTALAAKNDTTIRSTLQRLRSRASNRPCIYQQVLVGSNGQSPTPNQLRNVVRELLLYTCLDLGASLNSSFVVIDQVKTSSNWPEALTVQGRRKYLENDALGGTIKTRIDQTRVFCANLTERLKSLPSDAQDQPLVVPLVNYGYTINCEKRLSAHRNHRSSNYLMNLVEAVCEVLYPDQHFKMEQFVIFLVWRPEQAAVAEILFSRLGQGYISNGGGFSYHPAGRNNPTSSYRFWDALEEEAVHSPWFMLNKSEDAKRLQDWYEEVNAKVEALEASTRASMASQETISRARVDLISATQEGLHELRELRAYSSRAQAEAHQVDGAAQPPPAKAVPLLDMALSNLYAALAEKSRVAM